MDKNALKKAMLSSIADVFLGLSGAWVFIGYDAIAHGGWSDLLYSLALAILTFSTSVGIRYKYDKSARHY